TLWHSGGLAQQHRGRRRPRHEREASIAVDRDNHRDRHAGFGALRGGIERLAELHDVHAVLAQCRADGRTRIGLACRNLQLDVTRNLLSHVIYLSGASAGPGLPDVAFPVLGTNAWSGLPVYRLLPSFFVLLV